ncbi:helicase-related protein [Candidatus Sororendozoicomonas aggregata]|uniref:helicase-related protein n=1 Tax=Candidatus Sororendozoicomonas aggregata TaxID=3073239 RepID=UPI002ED2269B
MPLKDFPWKFSYKTSDVRSPGVPPVDILREFYIPFLQRVVRYDRVAGYFRSSSLALASRGMTAFVNRSGKMRLITGADMAPKDVQAVIDGQVSVLESHLNQELMESDQWPEEGTRGVELLSWMVRHGYLEIRVALRKHADTGEALTLDSGNDGYVHEKWALGYDEDDEVLYASGSWNESETALQRNAENVNVDCSWQGSKEREKIAGAQLSFETLWDNQHSAFVVKDLPSAVREKLLTFSESITVPVEIDCPPVEAVEREAEETTLSVSPEEALRFWAIRQAPLMPGGEFVGMYTAPVEPWPHQEMVARRLIESYPATHLMCDEVGLGKTIEAGLAFRSLLLSQRAKRILIAAPASLTRQWQREMASKFFLPFDRVGASPSAYKESLFPVEAKQSIGSLYEPDLTIISTGLMARRERRKLIDQADDFDIALVDEAHYARRQNSTQGTRGFPRYNQLYQTISDHLKVNCRSLLMATATPMQLDPVEVSDLIRLSNRVGAFQYDPSLMLMYYRLVSAVSTNGAISPEEWDFLIKIVTSIEQLDPKLWTYLKEVVIDDMSRLSLEQWLKNGIEPPPYDKPALARLLFAAAPLSRVMQRHTRDLLKIYRKESKLKVNLADRHVLTPPKIIFTDQEARVDGLLGEYCSGLKEQLNAKGLNAPGQTALGFYLSFLRLRFASSLSALKLTLERRKTKVEGTLIHQLRLENTPENNEELQALLLDGGDDDQDAVEVMLNNRAPDDLKWERGQLMSLLAELDTINDDSNKIIELMKFLKKRQEGKRIKQTVIFTRFLDTLHDIQNRLRARFPGLLIGTYSGAGGTYYDPKKNAMVSVERDNIKHRFVQGHIDVLLCTDAAAEGLNLQTADLLVNFDLPWNPMKVEQRIGRIDRIGQKHKDIHVLNLCFADSAEQFVYERLLSRLANANLVVGTQQFSMLPVTTEEFQKLAEGTMSQQDVEKEARERATRQKEHNKLMEVPVEEMFDVYVRLSQSYRQQKQPVSLADIWQILTASECLRSAGCVVSDCKRYMKVKGVEGIAGKVAMTTCRDLFDQGLDDETSLHFATYGDSVFEKVMDFVLKRARPESGFSVMEAEHEGIKVSGIACSDPSGHTQLITSVGQALARKSLGTPPEEGAIKRLKKTLINDCEMQKKSLQQIEQVEKNNLLQANAQVILNNQIIRSLVSSKLRTSSLDDHAPTLLKALEEQLRDRNTAIRVRDIPRDLQQKLAVAITQPYFPTQGAGYVDPPVFLELNAMESMARRIDANSQRQKTASGIVSAIEKSSDGIY